VFSGSADTTVLAWDAGRLLKKGRAETAELAPGQMENLWKDLAADDGARAFQAIVRLSDSPKATVAWLREHVKPVTEVPAKQLDQLIGDLDNDQFAVRRQATEKLEQLGDLAEPALRKVLAGQPSLEIRKRAEQVLEKLASNPVPGGDVLRALRSLEVLEQCGTPEARRLLQEIAGGAPAARLTRDAHASLERLQVIHQGEKGS